jgi:hypothetical protein
MLPWSSRKDQLDHLPVSPSFLFGCLDVADPRRQDRFIGKTGITRPRTDRRCGFPLEKCVIKEITTSLQSNGGRGAQVYLFGDSVRVHKVFSVRLYDAA